MQAAPGSLEFLSSLGVGGILAGGMFLYNRRDNQTWSKRFEEQQQQRLDAEKSHAEKIAEIHKAHEQRIAEISKDAVDRIAEAHRQTSAIGQDFRSIVQENSRAFTALHGFLMRSIEAEQADEKDT